MTDASQRGPWVLALGTLAIGVAAILVEGRRRRRDDDRDGTGQEPGS